MFAGTSWHAVRRGSSQATAAPQMQWTPEQDLGASSAFADACDPCVAAIERTVRNQRLGGLSAEPCAVTVAARRRATL